MQEEQEKVPLDAKLLSDVIIELNISRRNVSIYPKDHPSVEKSLRRAYEFLQKLFELRPEITLAVAKDTLIIDDYYLDRKNPVYREFALHLNKMNMAYVTFIIGLSQDELYEFHRIISQNIKEILPETFREMFHDLNLIHIKAGFIDYGAFAFEEGKTLKETSGTQLWERYVYGLLEGTLQSDDAGEGLSGIPPELLAGLLNRKAADDLREEAYDKVITSYIRRSSESTFSGRDLKRIMDFINELKPELKKQFLSSAVRTVSRDMDSAYKALGGISADEIIELLGTINEQRLVIPEALKNLLDKLSKLPHEGTEQLSLHGNLIVDDIFISPDIVNLFSGNFESFVSATYSREIQKLLDFSPARITITEPGGLGRAFSDDYIESDFNHTILELISSDILTDSEEYASFMRVLKEQIEQFLWTARYRQVLKTLEVLRSNRENGRFADVTAEILEYYHSEEFVSKLVDSLRLLGRQMREEAQLLCEYYGEEIISPLMDALTVEASQTVRRFLMGLLRQFGDKVIPETIKRLGDKRWFVKRNMLYLLGECESKEVLPHVRPYCRHENRKVGFEAIKCLLNAGDEYGISAVKDYLHSDLREDVELAIAMSGSFRIKEVVPDLIRMLRKRGISGADFYDKIPVVKALGEIGDPRAVEALKDLLGGKSFLYKGASEKLKEELYKSLKNYPYRDIEEIIRAGLKSRNDIIRQESHRLKEQISDQ